MENRLFVKCQSDIINLSKVARFYKSGQTIIFEHSTPSIGSSMPGYIFSNPYKIECKFANEDLVRDAFAKLESLVNVSK